MFTQYMFDTFVICINAFVKGSKFIYFSAKACTIGMKFKPDMIAKAPKGTKTICLWSIFGDHFRHYICSHSGNQLYSTLGAGLRYKGVLSQAILLEEYAVLCEMSAGSMMTIQDALLLSAKSYPDVLKADVTLLETEMDPRTNVAQNHRLATFWIKELPMWPVLAKKSVSVLWLNL